MKKGSQLQILAASLAIGLGSCFAPNTANAGFLGDTVQGTLHIGLSPLNFFSTTAPYLLPEPALVTDPGVEYLSNPLITPFNLTATDLGNDELIISILNLNLATIFIPDVTLILEDLDWQPGSIPIASVVHDDGMAPLSLSFTAHTITIHLGPISLDRGRSTFSHYTISVVNVPEPGTYLLLSSMTLIALLALPRRKKQGSAL